MFRRALLFVCSLTLASSALAAVQVIDGDTIRFDGETVRILNIDTPEIGEAGCDAERAAGIVAKHRLEGLLSSGRVTLKRGDGPRLRDRYGRTLARVFVDGRDVGEQLIAEGLARRWSGKRRPWCG